MNDGTKLNLQSLARGDLPDLLLQAGLNSTSAVEKSRLFHQASQYLIHRGIPSSQPAYAFFVPGRIEVLGKHTDYVGGSSLVCATERGFCMVSSKRSDHWINLCDVTSGESVSFPMTPELTPSIGHWSNYPMTVARRLARNFHGPFLGAEIAFASDIPPASGMSSSSAFMIAVALALITINQLDQTQIYQQHISSSETLAGYLATMENGLDFGSLKGDRGVGTFGGSEDQIAILCSQPSTLSLFSYAPVHLLQRIPMPQNFLFCVMASGVVAEKTGHAREKYNLLSSRMQLIRDLWNQSRKTHHPHVADILSSNPNHLDHLRSLIQASPSELNGNFSLSANPVQANDSSSALLRRLDHFVQENLVIIPNAVQALAGGDLPSFGCWVDQSQKASETLLGNQIPETVFLASQARKLGAVAASAFGAGFGGSVWAMVPKSEAHSFMLTWQEHYHRSFPQYSEKSHCFVTTAAPAAFCLH